MSAGNLWAEPWVARLGWVLIHFIWQGAGIALALALALRVLVGASSQVRYVTIGGALVLCGAMPVATWVALGPVAEPQAMTMPVEAGAVPAGVVPQGNFEPEMKAVSSVTSEPTWPERMQRLAEASLPFVVVYWLGGVSILTVRLTVGWTLLLRLCGSGRAVEDLLLRERFERLMERMGVGVTVRLLESALVEVPTLIGWLRPTILVPASVLTGLSPEQLEAILAHELAHVRRYDYLANLFQTVIETILFYHPAVWWISRKLREERENCCDDIAVQVMADKLVYASALARLEERRGVPLALTASGGSLVQRIRRIVGGNERKGSAWPLWVVLAGFFSVAWLPLTKGTETVFPIKDASGLAQSATGSGSRITVKCKLLEIPEDAYQANKATFDRGMEDASGAALISLMELIQKTKGASLVSAPSVTTRPGQKAKIEIVREFPYPRRFDDSHYAKSALPDGSSVQIKTPPTPGEFATKGLGFSVEVTPSPGEGNSPDDGKIILDGKLSVIDFEGFTKSNVVGTGTPSFTTREAHFLEAVKDHEMRGIWIPGEWHGEQAMADVEDQAQSGKAISSTLHVPMRLLLIVSAWKEPAPSVNVTPTVTTQTANDKRIDELFNNLRIENLKVTEMPLDQFVQMLTKELASQDPEKQGITFVLKVPPGKAPMPVSLDFTYIPHYEPNVMMILDAVKRRYPIRYRVDGALIYIEQLSQAEIAFKKRAKETLIDIDFSGTDPVAALQAVQAASAGKGFAFELDTKTIGELDAIKKLPTIDLKAEQVSVDQALRSIFYLADLHPLPLEHFTGYRIQPSSAEATKAVTYLEAGSEVVACKPGTDEEGQLRKNLEKMSQWSGPSIHSPAYNSDGKQQGAMTMTQTVPRTDEVTGQTMIDAKIVDKAHLQITADMEIKDVQGNSLGKVSGRGTISSGARALLTSADGAALILPGKGSEPATGFVGVMQVTLVNAEGEPLLPAPSPGVEEIPVAVSESGLSSEQIPDSFGSYPAATLLPGEALIQITLEDKSGGGMTLAPARPFARAGGSAESRSNGALKSTTDSDYVVDRDVKFIKARFIIHSASGTMVKTAADLPINSIDAIKSTPIGAGFSATAVLLEPSKLLPPVTATPGQTPRLAYHTEIRTLKIPAQLRERFQTLQKAGHPMEIEKEATVEQGGSTGGGLFADQSPQWLHTDDGINLTIQASSATPDTIYVKGTLDSTAYDTTFHLGDQFQVLAVGKDGEAAPSDSSGSFFTALMVRAQESPLGATWHKLPDD